MLRPDISRLRKNRSIYLKIGFILSLSLTIFAFNYTVYDYENKIYMENIVKDDPDIEVIRTKHEAPPLPPPPKMEVFEELLEDSTEFIEEPDPIEIPLEVAVQKTTESAPPKAKKPAPKPKPVPPPVIPEDILEADPLYTIVENMPEFGDCTKGGTLDERKKLSEKNLLQFIYKHIKYPRLALENGVYGRVFVRFIVDKEGHVIQPEIIREPGGGLGKEVLRVIGLMPQWKPGKQGIHNVKVQYTMPVEFKAK